MSAIAAQPPVVASPFARPAATPRPAGLTPGQNAGSAFGGGGLSGLFSSRTLMFALAGAVASVYIPPLAFLGGPIGGAVLGALVSFLI